MNPHRNTDTEEVDGAFWRRLVLSEEDRLFRSETVVTIEELCRSNTLLGFFPLSPLKPSTWS